LIIALSSLLALPENLIPNCLNDPAVVRDIAFILTKKIETVGEAIREREEADEESDGADRDAEDFEGESSPPMCLVHRSKDELTDARSLQFPQRIGTKTWTSAEDRPAVKR
jgi:hypothetical protein